jgi:hypothetical protein
MVSQPRVERLEGDIGITGDTVAFGREDRFCGGRWCDIVVGRRFAVPAVSGHLEAILKNSPFPVVAVKSYESDTTITGE